MVEVFYDLVRRRFQVTKIYQQPNIVQLLAASIDLDLVIVPMQIFALSLYPRS